MKQADSIQHNMQSCDARESEDGFILLAVMFLLALLVLWLAVAVPQMSKSIQRDRDVETMRRGKQYIRAIQLYYRKFHAYPPNVDALVKTNDIRFLRKKYIDPTTGKDDWKPILFGQNKVPTAMGFFGQPLTTGGSVAGVGPSGGNGLNGANGSSPSGGLFNSSGGSGFGSSSGSSIFDNSNSGSTPAPPAGSTTNSSTTSSGTNTTSGGTTSGTGGTDTGLGGSTGQTFGGAGIIGFSPASPKQSILVYKKKDHYNEWEFTYDPIMEMMGGVGGGNTGTIGQPAGTSGVPGFGGANPTSSTPTGSGSQNGQTPGSSTGSSPSPVTPPETSAPQ